VKVVLTPTARDELSEIWVWNAKDRGILHADKYIEFLERSIATLSKKFEKGRLVGDHPNFRYIVMKRSSKGHGHIAVYEVDGNEVRVLHIFHTAQNWQSKISAA